MNKLSHWLTGAASVLAALFANVASGNAAGGETQPETQQNVPDVSAAARDQIGTKASRIGQDEVIIDKPQIDPGEEKGKVTFAESDDKIWFKDSSPFKEGNTPSFSDNKGSSGATPFFRAWKRWAESRVRRSAAMARHPSMRAPRPSTNSRSTSPTKTACGPIRRRTCKARSTRTSCRKRP